MSKHSKAFKIRSAQRFLKEGGSRRIAKELGISSTMLRYWGTVYRLHGENAFSPPMQPYSAQNKLNMLSKMWTQGWSLGYTSAYYNLSSPGLLSKWQRCYKEDGVERLLSLKRGRPLMNKTPPVTHKKTSDMTPKEMQEELEYLRAENAVLKKLEALRHQKRAQTKTKR
ncbi:MAG: transposase [Methylophaga sp.]|uniref:transposase n=1 Tax=Methylophaga sp. TaxID=2024840 RepID=UPI00299EA090|nr:transposase [Methylophaga sp.]MDX1751102.1 transposase [Methylophaga sp.]